MADESMGKLKRLQNQTASMLSEDGPATESEMTRLHKFVHFWALVVRSFVRNRCPVRASALAYASLLALVPMLAVVVSVSSSLLKKEGEQPIDRFIEKIVGQLTPESSASEAPVLPINFSANDANVVAARKEAVKRIKGFVDNIRSGALGVTGMVALVFVAISMLERIEGTFNDIWGVTRGRSWYARIVYYWAALTLGPLLLMVALGLTTSGHLEFTKDLLGSVPIVGKLLFGLLPLLLLCLAFALFYVVMPNTKVQWRAALVGGVVGGGLWHLNNLFNVLYVSRVVSNSKIYGSLGMIPVFMIGLYFSWIILLFGSQVAYAYQNRASYLQDRVVETVSQQGREFIALRLMGLVGRRFHEGKNPMTMVEISSALAVPSRLVGQILRPLTAARLLVEVAGSETRYAPGRPLIKITLEDVLEAARSSQGQTPETSADAMRALVREEYAKILEAQKRTASVVTLEDLAVRAGV